NRIDYLAIPRPAHGVYELGRSCIRVFDRHLPREKKIHEVGYQQQSDWACIKTFGLVREELKQSVERQELNSGAREDLAAVDQLKDRFHRSGGSFVSIAYRRLDDFAFGVQQAVVDAPTINRDALNDPSQAACSSRGLACAFGQLFEDLIRVPAQVAVYLHG